MSKKKTNTALNIAFLIVHLGFCTSASLMIKSEQFPVVWRYSMFLNAPNSLVIISLVLATIMVAPLHILLTRATKPLKNAKINPTIYYIDFVAVFALLFFFTQLGLIANGAFDKTSPETHTVRITSKNIKTDYRAPAYYIYCQDWVNSGNTVQIRVNSSKYEIVEVGDSIQVVTQKGFLGYEWIVNRRQIMNGTR